MRDPTPRERRKGETRFAIHLQRDNSRTWCGVIVFRVARCDPSNTPTTGAHCERCVAKRKKVTDGDA